MRVAYHVPTVHNPYKEERRQEKNAIRILCGGASLAKLVQEPIERY